MIRRPPRSTQSRSSAASDVYKRQPFKFRSVALRVEHRPDREPAFNELPCEAASQHPLGSSDQDCQLVPPSILLADGTRVNLSLIHISEPTRLGMISYAVFCL